MNMSRKSRNVLLKSMVWETARQSRIFIWAVSRWEAADFHVQLQFHMTRQTGTDNLNEEQAKTEPSILLRSTRGPAPPRATPGPQPGLGRRDSRGGGDRQP